MKMYFAYDRDTIREVEVERATDKSVWIMDTVRGKPVSFRRQRISEIGYEAYFNTWVEARDWLVHINDGDIRYFNRLVDEASYRLERIQAMKEPTT